MNVKIDPKDVADSFSEDLTFMRTLLGAAQDKAVFYLENRKLLGPQCELLLLWQLNIRIPMPQSAGISELPAFELAIV